jgi:hypothetical protein
MVKRQICFLLMLAALSAAPAGAAEPPPKPGSCPNAMKPLPRSVTRAADRILKDMYPQLRDELLRTKRGDLVRFQQGWGTGIRNSLCLKAGGNDQLIRSACEGKLCDPEDASMVIMETVWDRLQSVQRVLRPGEAPNSKS